MTFDEAEKQFKAALKEAKAAADFAAKELTDLSRASSLAVSQLGGTTKDAEARPSDFDLFDENDGLTKEERRMWAARDSYDMKERS